MCRLLTTLILLLTVGVHNALAAYTAQLSPRKNYPITLNMADDTVRLNRDLLLTITAEAPVNTTLQFPDLRAQNRWQGFSRVEDFTTQPIQTAEKTTSQYRWKLTPQPGAERYRLAPFAVQVLDATTGQVVDSFATQPVLLPPPPSREPVTGAYQIDPQPAYISPAPREIALWIAYVLGGVLLVALLIYALTHIKRKIREYRMTPAERALDELARLLAKQLPDHGLLKDFYIEITHIVRRYIERTYGIRAPNQTTDEFLAAVRSHPRFTSAVISSLADFLRHADLIKFAGAGANSAAVEAAIASVKTYIETDSHKENAPGNN